MESISSNEPLSIELHLEGLNCPLPLLKTKLQLKDSQPGDLLEVWCTDQGAFNDFPLYFAQTAHELLECKALASGYYFKIKSAGG